jgi:hypothetical protein
MPEWLGTMTGCFACSSAATVGVFDLNLEEKTLDEVGICRECLGEFRDADWIEVLAIAE